MERKQKKAIECLKPWNHLMESPCNGFAPEQRHLFSALGQAHRRAGTQAGDQTPAVSSFTGWCRRVFSTVDFFKKTLVKLLALPYHL